MPDLKLILAPKREKGKLAILDAVFILELVY